MVPNSAPRLRTPPAMLLILGALFLLFVCCKGLQHYSFKTNDYDTGIYSNLAWNIAHGHGFYSSILQKNHLGEHFSPIMALFAPLYWLFPSALILLFAQALAVALTFLILWWICGEIFGNLAPRSRIWMSGGILLLYLLYRPMLSALWFQFHPSTLGMPLVAGAILCLHRRKTMPFWILLGFLLLTKENAPASVLGLAIYAILVLQQRKMALHLSIAAAVSAVAILFILMPLFREHSHSWAHLVRLGPFAHLEEKLAYLWRLVLPLGLLPLLGWRAALAAVPLTLINLSSNFEPQWSMKFHYDDQSSVFWIVAAAHGAKRFWTILGPRRLQHHLRITLRWGVAILIACLAIIYRGDSPFREIGRCWPTADVVQAHALLQKFGQLPSSIPVAAQSGLGPHLCNRFAYQSVKGSPSGKSFAPGTVVFLSSVAGGFNIDFQKARQHLRNTHRFIPLSQNPLLLVYQLRASHKEP